MSEGIFVERDGELIELSEAAYDSEAVLQELLAKHPSLLAGKQISPDSPRNWLLVCREASLPCELDGGGRWAVDHVFLDQDAVPTLVEVKRSSDTRIRREVVGQMLDYAANGVAYWPIEAIRSSFEMRCSREGVSAEELLSDLIGQDADQEKFWADVRTNLQAGRVRMIFIADSIPSELRRVVEFLNTQMDPAEVLAIEIRKFEGSGVTTFIPRVIGLTAQAQQRKLGSTPARLWDESSFLEALRVNKAEAMPVAKEILAWALSKNIGIHWGKGRQLGSFMVDGNGRANWLLSVWTDGTYSVLFEQFKKSEPFSSLELRQELLQKLKALAIPEMGLRDDDIERRRHFPLIALRQPTKRSEFLAVMEWAIDRMRQHQ
jgi:hypothetical protein